MPYYYLKSLGCPKNLVDSERFAALLESAGYTPTTDESQAELILVNTCGFIADAKTESIDTILELAEQKQNGACKQLVVTGCLVQRYMQDLQKELPEVDHFVGLKDFERLAALTGGCAGGRKLLTLPHYAYLRVSDGCNNNCAYCAIPLIRGKMVSEPLEEIVEEAKRLANQGVKELILLAQDTATWGRDIYGKSSLPKLLPQLAKIDGIAWIRLLYLHPAHIDDELLHSLATTPKVLPYLEIPFQHINSGLLSAMNRHIDKDGIMALLAKIKQQLPQAVLRTTFICGLPGEVPKSFKELKEFVQQQRFGRLGVFAYSPEENTPAAYIKPRPSAALAQKRVDEIMVLQQEISQEFMAGFVGKTLEVIMDEVVADGDYNYIGRSWYDAPEIDGNVFVNGTGAQAGDIVQVKITHSFEYDLCGEIVPQTED